ncbi:MAG TPA: prepilin-type N-terminal cleavage/methylation domain-containing protein [Thermodesulfobacteriota bacterium]|nr:prepilin-type N-terminal cleavage/methylation domain-containing protein [Thermodesulfobacteriota bacterium]
MKKAEKGKTRTSRGERGFTLLELLVVLLLLGFIFLLTFPNFRNFFEPRDAKRAVLQLAGSVKYAQSQAATTKLKHRLNMDLKENNFWISREGEKDSFIPDPSPMGKPGNLPSGVIFLDLVYPEREKVREGTGYLEFSPTGWAEECAIHLSRGEQEIFTIFIHPLGGKIEVAPGYAERWGR